MDAYPPEYVAHNLPFIVLSGLGDSPEFPPPRPLQDVLPGRAVTTISSELPPLTSERAQQLLQEFLSYNGPNVGRGRDGRGYMSAYRMRAVGRVGQAPAGRLCGQRSVAYTR
jgi:hypothetical protein